MGLCSHILHLHQRDTEGVREGDDGSLHQFLSTQIQHRHGQHHPLLSSLEGCHHQLQSRKSCNKVRPIVIQFATARWAADNCKRHAIWFGDVIHIPH